MEFEGCFNSYIMDDPFPLEPVVHPDSSQNLPMFNDSSDQNILGNNPSDYPLTFDQSNNTSLISPNDVSSARNNNNVCSHIAQTHNVVCSQIYQSANQMEPCGPFFPSNNFPNVVEEHDNLLFDHSVNVDGSSADQANLKSVSKQPWTAEEDQKLIDLVKLHGEDWSRIAKMFSCRTGKQCRAKWCNYLRPGIKSKKDLWSEQEDMILIEAHKELGSKWSKIARRLPGRTENYIKNRWYSHKRKCSDDNVGRRRYRIPGSSLLQNHMQGLVQFPAADGSVNMPDAVQQTSNGDQGATSSSNLSNQCN